MLTCPKCKTEYEEGKKFCKLCGAALLTTLELKRPEPTETIYKSRAPGHTDQPSPLIQHKEMESYFCPSCKTPYQKGQKFCKGCGMDITITEKHPYIPQKEPKKSYLKSLIKTEANLSKQKISLENLLHNLEEQRGRVSEATFSSTQKTYVKQIESINDNITQTQRNISELRSRLVEKVISLEKETTSFQNKLNEFKSLYNSGGLSKEDYKIEKKRLEKEIEPRKKEFRSDRELLNFLIKETSPKGFRDKLIPIFVKACGGILILLLLAIGVLYLASSYYNWKPEFVENIEEKLFPPSDLEIAFNVKEELGRHDRTNIGVKVIEGKIILSGKASSEEEREVIQNLAASVKGVEGVENNIVIEQIVRDEIILSEIQRGFKNKGYESIRAKVNNGIVTLSGRVPSPEEQNLILSTAMNIDGVKQVENNIEIVKIPTDSEIASIIRNELSNKGYEEIEVNVSNRKAALKGTVNSSKERESILGTAENVEWIEEVKNNIKIKPIEPPDKEIAQSVIQRLVNNGYSGVSVNVINGKAILSGTVDSVSKRNAIKNIAMAVIGVKDVDNNISVVEPIYDNDLYIQSEIKKAIARNGYSGINVSVEDGEVYLSGTVRTHQDHLALHDMALKINGVKRVKSSLSVLEYR